jgi:hypothetical protein
MCIDVVDYCKKNNYTNWNMTSLDKYKYKKLLNTRIEDYEEKQENAMSITGMYSKEY